jgi:hypothetical protein
MVEKPKSPSSKPPGEGMVGSVPTDDQGGYGVSAAGLANLHAEFSRQLSQLAAKAQEHVGNSFAAYQRALGDAQTSVQSQQEAAMRDYLGKMQRATPQSSQSEFADHGRLYQEACRSALEAGQVLAEDAVKILQSAVDSGINEANGEWDATIARYIATLQQAVGQLSANHVDPTALAALAQSFAWVSGQVNVNRTINAPR